MRRSLAFCVVLFLSFPTYPQGSSGGSAPPHAQLPIVFNAADAGAVCDGVTDAATAINSVLSAIRTIALVPFPAGADIGRPAKFVLGGRSCLIRSTINLTGLYGAGFTADFRGSSIVCKTNGTPCVDGTGDGQIAILGLNIDAPSDAPPNIGLALGRITNNSVGADHNVIDHPTISGFFTLAPFFNNQSETTLITGATFANMSVNAYGAIWDGSNHFNFQSAFTGQTYPADTYASFNENICEECIIRVSGSGSVPVWIGATAKHRFVNSYVASGAAVGPEIILWFGAPGGGKMNDLLDLDIHFEGSATSLVQFQGASAINQNGLAMRDYFPEQNGPIFSRGGGVSTVNIGNAHFEFGTLAGTGPSWWDDGTKFTVSGYIYDRDNSYTAPNAFTGMLCGPTSCAVH